MAGADAFDTAIALFESGRLAEAEAVCRQLIAGDARHSGALLILGMARAQNGDLTGGLALLERSLSIQPNVPLGQCFRGWVLTQLGRPDEALTSYGRAIALQPDFQEAHYNAGHLLLAANRVEEALKAFDAAVRLPPDLPQARCARAVVLSRLNRLGEALTALNEVLAGAPDFVPALNLRSDLLCEMGRHEEALADAIRSLALDPSQAQAHVSRATALMALHRPGEAQTELELALRIQTDFASAIMLRGVLHRDAGRLEASLADCERAVALVPGDTMAHVNRAATLLALGRHEEALQALDRAAALGPHQPKVFATRAIALRHLQRYDEALADCDRALALDSGIGPVAAERLLLSALLCDWRDRQTHLDRLADCVRQGNTVSPWVIATSFDDPALQLQAAKRASLPAAAAIPKTPGHDRLRIAYLSPDFHEHPSAHLIVELIEQHDRARVETFGIALHDGPQTEIRQRLTAAFEHHVYSGSMSDAEVVAMMRREEIDIAVDLSGHAGGGRPGIFVLRPAPLVVNFAGHPGTLGADWADYILADCVVVASGGEKHFSEAVVRLPDCYLPSDTRYAVADAPTRARAGLPESGFVFCSFNASYKITPALFDIWMRLLGSVEGSVLWLLAESASTRRNLQAEALARGIDPQRLVFADRVARSDHLARLKLADLFLDTLPCNAHTTASDALQMGVPLVTTMGKSLAARVAGSMLTAVGLPDLIAADLAAYEAAALDLARSPERIGAVRQRLAQRLPDCALFDMARLARHIETAYETMWGRFQAGLPPAGFDVPAMRRAPDA